MEIALCEQRWSNQLCKSAGWCAGSESLVCPGTSCCLRQSRIISGTTRSYRKCNFARTFGILPCQFPARCARPEFYSGLPGYVSGMVLAAGEWDQSWRFYRRLAPCCSGLVGQLCSFEGLTDLDIRQAGGHVGLHPTERVGGLVLD